MSTPLRNRLLFNARAQAYDAADKVKWVDATMYDRETTVDLYDTATLDKEGGYLSTFRSPSDLEFLEMVEALDIRSVLDIGCGTGAFYHALASIRPNLTYFGYDLSTAQIARAISRFGERFAARDISTISEDEFAKYDAIHCFSVFSFMPVADQLATISRILRSGTKLLLETGVTLPDVRYVPRSAFKNFLKLEIDGQALMTTVSFPFKSELEAVVANSGHSISYVEKPYSRSRLLNQSDGAGGALIGKSELVQKHPRFDKLHPNAPTDILITARIAPDSWNKVKSRDYSVLTPDEVYASVLQMLKPLTSKPQSET